MADDPYHLYSSEKFQATSSLNKGFENEEVVNRGEDVPVSGVENSGRLHSRHMVETRGHLLEDQWHPIYHTHKGLSDDAKGALRMPSPVQSIIESKSHAKLPNLIAEPSEGGVVPNPSPSFTDSFELLSCFQRGNETLRYQNLNNPSSTVTEGGRKLSTEEIIRVAAERYIEFSNKKLDGITTFIHPFGSPLSNLSEEETRGIDLVHLLLAAAEKVEYKNFDSADRYLIHCERMISYTGNSVERVAFYFAEALRKRISRETRSTGSEKVSEQLIDTGMEFTMLASYNHLPFDKVIQFAATQEIVDSVAMASEVHVIDLQIRSGIHLTGLMQAFSERKGDFPVGLLKITAVVTTGIQKAEETGKRLEGFAMSLNIPFLFQVVFSPDLKDINQHLFDIKVGEAVVVYCPTVLSTMLSRPDRLQNLMGVIQSLRPSIMVVSEIEANHNSPSFANRFAEALFFYGAYFDCLDECMDRNNLFRADIERNHCGKGIVNIVATEGDERIARCVTIEVWRAFFARFQMVEIELSKSSLYQAKLVLEQQFSCGSSCTLHNNGKCLIVGWKRTPIHSLSLWKFNQDY